MQRGCELSREHGFDYDGVGDFSTDRHSQEVLVREGMTVQKGGFNGVLPSTRKIEDDEYAVVSFYYASLTATMANAEGIEILRGSGEVVDARTCLVYSRPD